MTEMTEQFTRLGKRVTRDDLYALVWQRPMVQLAAEFQISGNELAKICDRLNVPYPPRGYWAKKAAGKPTVTFKLPPRKDGVPAETRIHPTPPKPTPSPETQVLRNVAVEKLAGVAVPDGLEGLHPRVKAWIDDHRRQQKEREAENKRRRHDTWWRPALLRDLTDRDLYRFRVTSAIFKGVEKAGGKIKESPITGRVTFLIAGHDVGCAIVEKLLKSFKDRSETDKWTAYPEHHQSGLASSGFLRVAITTYLEGHQHQWIETSKTKVGDLLPDIVGMLIAAGPILGQQKREREEQAKRSREAEAQRYEARRQRELDEKRWSKFREFAANWEERSRLLTLLAEVEKRSLDGEDTMIGERPLSLWIAWARERIERLDPLRQGVAGMFDAVGGVPHG